MTRCNLEASEEIARQLRLRDIGGMVMIDYVDMVMPANRDLVLRRLVECLAPRPTKHQVAEVTSLGLVQMTRKRIGQGLVEAFSRNARPARAVVSSCIRSADRFGRLRRSLRARGGDRSSKPTSTVAAPLPAPNRLVPAPTSKPNWLRLPPLPSLPTTRRKSERKSNRVSCLTRGKNHLI